MATVTLDDCVVLARALVRACEDVGYRFDDTPRHEARSTLRDVEDLLAEPSDVGCRWTSCLVPTLLGYVEQAYGGGRPARARVYEACIAVRLLAAEVGREALAVGATPSG